MKGKYYKRSKEKKLTQLQKFQNKVDGALVRARRRGKAYIEWDLKGMYREFIEKHYVYKVSGVEVDLYSFNPFFSITACRSNTVKNLYYKKRNGLRYTIENFDKVQIKECQEAGLKLERRKYRIYGPKIA